MNLYLIKTDINIYATNANSASHALAKFNLEYPYYDYQSIKEIPVDSLVGMDNNDEIIFF